MVVMSRDPQDDANLPLKFSSILSASLHIDARCRFCLALTFELFDIIEFCFLSFAVLLFEVFQFSFNFIVVL